MVQSQSVKECQRCVSTSAASGQRCKNRTCKAKRCWQHLKRDKGLRIKQSTIPGAGLGLFATKRIPRNTRIVAYEGEQLSRDQVEERYPGNTIGEYTLCGSNAVGCKDGRKTNSGAARFANDSRGTSKTNNARFNRAGQLSLRTTNNRPVQAGAEILVSYGPEYWGRRGRGRGGRGRGGRGRGRGR